MALIKKVETDYGIIADYWKVSRISLDIIKNEISFTLNLYLNKKSKQELGDYTFVSSILNKEEFEPLYEKYFKQDREENYKDIYTACYKFSKENIDFFKDALDDEEELIK